MKTYLPFILWFLLAEAILFAVQFPLRKKQPRALVRVLLILLKALLGIGFAALMLAGPLFLRPVQPLMTGLYAALFTDAAADAVYSLVCYLRDKRRNLFLLKAVSLVFGAAFVAFGIVNMQSVRANYHTYSSPKLTREHTFVYLADLHVGGAQSFETTENTIREIISLSPDFIVLDGDITDDYTSKEEMLATWELFRGCGCDVFYAYGNHDRQKHAEYANGLQYTPEELADALTACGVKILKDEFCVISDDLVLLGREDLSEGDGRADIASLHNPVPGAYLVVADHQPAGVKGNLACGMDLQVSGHTHAGQLFPLRALYSLAGYVCGDYQVGDAILNVSAGACGWRMPFRTDAHCAYEVITLQPEQ